MRPMFQSGDLVTHSRDSRPWRVVHVYLDRQAALIEFVGEAMNRTTYVFLADLQPCLDSALLV